MAERLVTLTLSALTVVTAGVWLFAAAPFIVRPVRVDLPSLVLVALFSLTGWTLWRTWLARRAPTGRFLWLLASWAALTAQLALVGWLYG